MERFRMELESLSKNEEFARVVVTVFMSRLDPTLEEIDDVKTAVSEAVTNAEIHGYGGDWSGYESHSSADFALLKMLTFWTQDETQLDSIFRSSGLYRPKWDKCNGYYGKYQIGNALRLTTATRKNSMEM